MAILNNDYGIATSMMVNHKLDIRASLYNDVIICHGKPLYNYKYNGQHRNSKIVQYNLFGICKIISYEYNDDYICNIVNHVIDHDMTETNAIASIKYMKLWPIYENYDIERIYHFMKLAEYNGYHDLSHIIDSYILAQIES